MPEQTYQHGVYCVLDEVPYASSVRSFIETQAFRDICRCEPFATSNRRNKLYAFDFEPAGRRLVVKVSAVDPGLQWRRRASLFLTSLAKNYPRASFAGARILSEAGIPGAAAVAYWTYRPSFRRLEGYYLYEEIPARTSVHRFRVDIGAEPTARDRRAFERMVEEIAEIARALHSNGIRHGALELGNFLVDFGNGAPRPRSDEEAENPRLYLIDTDRVSKARILQPFLKRILDINCLRRLDFDRQGRRAFLRHYLGEDYSPGWEHVLELWRLRRFRLRSWLRGEPRGLTTPLQPR
ncbi:MAG: lipopolysaccharide kinase InaA family protein [Gammaproteobacteria bacterium]